MKKPKRQRQEWGYWAPAMVETKWDDTLTWRAIDSEKMPSHEFSVRVPQGTLTIKIPAGATHYQAGQIMNDVFRALSARLRHRKIDARRAKEDFEITFHTGTQKFPELRHTAQYKEPTLQAFRQRIQRMRANAQERPLLNKRQHFLLQNHTMLVTVKNSLCKDKPGLQAWKPKAIIELMRSEGVLGANASYDADDLRKWRFELNSIRRCLTYSVRKMPR